MHRSSREGDTMPRPVAVCCAIFLTLCCIRSAQADPLSDQLQILRDEQKYDIIATEALSRQSSIIGLATISNPYTRDDVAHSLADRRALDDIAYGHLATADTILRQRALLMERAPNLDQLLGKDIELTSLSSGYFISNSSIEQMKDPYGSIESGGSVKPFPGATMATLPAGTSNPLVNPHPDPTSLGFSMSFVVEVHVAGKYAAVCSGSFVGSHLILTARHCLEEAGNRVPLSRITVVPLGSSSVIHAANEWLADPSSADLAQYGAQIESAWDVAFISTRESAPTATAIADLGNITGLKVWVLMAGAGVIDTTAARATANQGYISSPQPLFLDSYSPNNISGSIVFWSDPLVVPGASSQCDGDSGGPVFAVGTRDSHSVPIVVGVLSARGNGPDPSDIASCHQSWAGQFVNLGNSIVWNQLQKGLASFGVQENLNQTFAMKH